MGNTYSDNITKETTIHDAINLRFEQDARETVLAVLQRIRTRRRFMIMIDGVKCESEANQLSYAFGVEIECPNWIDNLIEQVEALTPKTMASSTEPGD